MVDANESNSMLTYFLIAEKAQTKTCLNWKVKLHVLLSIYETILLS